MESAQEGRQAPRTRQREERLSKASSIEPPEEGATHLLSDRGPYVAAAEQERSTSNSTTNTATESIDTRSSSAASGGVGMTFDSESAAYVDIAINQYVTSCARHRTTADPAVLNALRKMVLPVEEVASSGTLPPTTATGDSSFVLCFILGNTTLNNVRSGASATLGVGGYYPENRLAGIVSVMEGLRGIPLAILSLKDCYLQDAGLHIVASSIGSDPTLMSSLIEIDLRGNSLHGESCAGLSYLLTSCRELRSLRLGWNKLGFDGGMSGGGATYTYGDALHQATTTDDGTPPSNAIGSLFAAVRAHRRLQVLELSNNMIYGAPTTLLALVQLILSRSPATLKTIDLGWNSLSCCGVSGSASGSSAGAAIHGAIIRNNNIENLVVDGNGFTRREVEAIAAKLYANQRSAVDHQLTETNTAHLIREVKTLQTELDTARAKFNASNASQEEQRKNFLQLQHMERVKVERLTAEIVDLKGQLEGREEEAKRGLADARAGVYAADERALKHQARCDELESKNDLLRRELEIKSDGHRHAADAAAATIATLGREVRALEDSKQLLSLTVDRAHADLQQAQGELSEVRGKAVILQSEVESLRLEASRLKSTTTMQGEELTALRAKVTDLNASLLNTTMDLKALEEVKVRLDREVLHNAEQTDRLVEDAKRAEKAIAAKEVQRLESLLQRKDDAIARLEERLGEEAQTYSRSLQKHQDEIAHLTAKDARREELQAKLNASEVEVARLKRVESMFEAKIQSLNNRLELADADSARAVAAVEQRLNTEIALLDRHLHAKEAELEATLTEAVRLKRRLLDEQQANKVRVQRMEERLVVNLRRALHSTVDDEAGAANEGGGFGRMSSAGSPLGATAAISEYSSQDLYSRPAVPSLVSSMMSSNNQISTPTVVVPSTAAPRLMGGGVPSASSSSSPTRTTQNQTSSNRNAPNEAPPIAAIAAPSPTTEPAFPIAAASASFEPIYQSAAPIDSTTPTSATHSVVSPGATKQSLPHSAHVSSSEPAFTTNVAPDHHSEADAIIAAAAAAATRKPHLLHAGATGRRASSLSDAREEEEGESADNAPMKRKSSYSDSSFSSYSSSSASPSPDGASNSSDDDN